MTDNDTFRHVRAAVNDAASPDDLVDSIESLLWDEHDMLVSPHDAETLDERSARGMGERYEPRRRDAT